MHEDRGQLQTGHVPNPDSLRVLFRFCGHKSWVVRPLNLRNSSGWSFQANLFKCGMDKLGYVFIPERRYLVWSNSLSLFLVVFCTIDFILSSCYTTIIVILLALMITVHCGFSLNRTDVHVVIAKSWTVLHNEFGLSFLPQQFFLENFGPLISIQGDFDLIFVLKFGNQRIHQIIINRQIWVENGTSCPFFVWWHWKKSNS